MDSNFIFFEMTENDGKNFSAAVVQLGARNFAHQFLCHLKKTI
jgi:hypothetical protein